MTAKRETVILAPGPLHLFWTTGVYYMWELSSEYKVVLVVDESYRSNAQFFVASELAGVSEILYAPAAGAISRHCFYAGEMRGLVARCRPAAILHHDAISVQMRYLHHWARRFSPKFLRISYLSGLAVHDHECAYKMVADFNVQLLADRLRVPRLLAAGVYFVKSWLSLWFNHYLLPLAYVRVAFRPLMNMDTGCLIDRYWNAQFDNFLMYSKEDWTALRNWCGSDDGFVTIKHPVCTAGGKANAGLFGITEQSLTVIMPSYGYINSYMREHGLSGEDTVSLVAESWIKAAIILKEKFPENGMVIKLHPAQHRDQLWRRIIGCILRSCPDIREVDSFENGQEWVLRGRIIVSDYSTVLWWASFFESKTAISLNLFGTRSTDEMKYRGNVRYFDNLKDFAAAEFGHATRPAQQEAASLTEYLHAALAAKGRAHA